VIIVPALLFIIYFQIVIFFPRRGRIIIVNKDEKGVSETINFYTIVVVSSFLMKNVANNAASFRNG
jgi:hypothetical protein